MPKKGLCVSAFGLSCPRVMFVKPLPFQTRQRLINTVLNLLFPADCVVCGEPVKDWRSGPLCPACESSFKPVKPPFCSQCGFAISEPDMLCGNCLTGKTQYDLGRSALTFDTSLREVIHHFKYNDRVSLARPLGRALEACLGSNGFAADRIVPVPLYRKRERQRGYNQAALLAARLGLDVQPDVIRRRKNTESQTGLTRSKRIRNGRGAFECSRPISGQILIVDDVQTTGATTNEVARVLKKAGATRVEVLTVARVGLP